MTSSKLSNSCWTLFLTQTFKMVAHTAAVLASQFIPSWKLSLTFSTVLICSVPRHGSTHSNSSGHICGTSPDCSWSICDIFSGPLLVSIHKITAHTHWHSCYKYCMLYITKFCQGEKKNTNAELSPSHFWVTVLCNQRQFSQMTTKPSRILNWL